jgi:enamine deaminase RidA (YjgF/YER057c/UK114 family)
MVSSPVENFARYLPTMIRIWESRQVSGRVLRERLADIQKNLHEIDNIIQQTYENRQASLDRIGADWTEVIRDQTVVEDSPVGERRYVPLSSVNELIRGLNEAAGYERYRHIPLRELQ